MAEKSEKQLVVGILAHVDSGKTTLSEAMLYRAGSIRKLGRVDNKDAFLDTDRLEKARGITIFSKQALLKTGSTNITLLDTPGHVDFSTETERTLQVLDYAVLVISGTDGVQSHTETLWRLLRRYHIPTFVFINKMDLPGPGKEALLSQLSHRLGDGFVDFGAEQAERDEALALCDERLMEKMLDAGSLTAEDIIPAIARRHVFPCWFGVALQRENAGGLQGVDELLAGLDEYTRAAPALEAFGARVFKVSQDERGERLTWLRVTGGELKVKAQLTGEADGEPWAEKANQLRLYSGAKYTLAEAIGPGQVCAVTGLTRAKPGTGLGAERDSDLPVLEPVLSYRVCLPEGADVHAALGKLHRLEEEEPQLHVVWNETLGEIHVQLMGEIQLEVLKSLLAERYGLDVEFDSGGILYKETITEAIEGVGHYEPLRHYAEVHLKLEPLPRGSGMQFAANCREEELDKNWQRLVLTHLEEKQHLGVLIGAPLTDMKITLIAGRAHLKHTEGGDFRQATYRAVRQGLMMANQIKKTQLLEPWYSFRLEVPAENIGRAMSDVQRMEGSFDPPEMAPDGQTATLTGFAPVAAMRSYPMEVVSYTRGRGHLNLTLDGYRPCHNAAEVIEAVGYEPEHDLDNPADSVFCSHGAGFVVPWEQVRSHMHVDSGWGRTAPTAEETAARPRRMAAYRATLEEDAELLKIFERTYGPIKRDPPGAEAGTARFRRRAVGDRPRIPAGGWLQHHLCVGRAERPLQGEPRRRPPPADGHSLQLSGLQKVRPHPRVRCLPCAGQSRQHRAVPQHPRRLHQRGRDGGYVHRARHPRDRQKPPGQGGDLRRHGAGHHSGPRRPPRLGPDVPRRGAGRGKRDKALHSGGGVSMTPEITAEFVWSHIPKRPRESNKGSFGAVLAVAGSACYRGAASLTVEGALRTGAGIVTLASVEPVLAAVSARLPECCLCPCEPGAEGGISPQSIPRILRQKATVLLIGPGLGYLAQSTARAAETRTLVKKLLTGFSGSAVLDADGLNAAASLMNAGEELPRPAKELILTPHPGEMSRLTGLSVEAVQADREGVARRYAAQWNAVVVLKGARTVVAAPDGRVCVNPTGNPGLARGGSGDVLAGMMSALLACGLSACEAAACAVWLHGAAADRAARQKGEYGMLPQDIFAHLGQMFAENDR